MATKPSLDMLTMIGVSVNKLIARGDTVTFDEIYSGLQERTLLETLINKFQGFIDVYKPKDDKTAAFYNVISNVAGAYQGEEVRKYGIKNNGLSLLLYFILEAIFQRDWD